MNGAGSEEAPSKQPEEIGDQEEEMVEHEPEQEQEQDQEEKGKGDKQEKEDEEAESALEREIDYKCQLYVRFPCILPPVDEIKALHPSILHVFARKRKKPKFCYLAFSTPETAQKALEELSAISYKDQGHLDVRPKDDHRMLPRPTGSATDRKRWLIVYGVPATEPDSEVLEAFRRFGCTHAHVHRQDINEVLKKGSARLVFNTAEDSETFMADKNLHNYKGTTLEVRFLKTGPSKSARKRQRRNQRRQQGEEANA